MQDSTVKNKREKFPQLDKTQWQALIAEWEMSSENQKQFCDRLGLNFNTFSYARGKLLSANKNPVKNKKFIPVQTVKHEDHKINPMVSIMLENSHGIKLHIPLSMPPEQLSKLLKLAGWSHA